MKNRKECLVAPVEPLTTIEKEQLVDCERKFRLYCETSLQAGGALFQIRESRLYREMYKSFGQYCEKHLGYCRSQADRLIGAWRVDQWIAPTGVKIENVYQARPLLGFEQEDVLRIIPIALRIADGQPLTHYHFALAVEKLYPQRRKKSAAALNHRIPITVTADALRLIDLAESAVKSGDSAGAMKALQQIRQTLTQPKPVAPTPATESKTKRKDPETVTPENSSPPRDLVTPIASPRKEGEACKDSKKESKDESECHPKGVRIRAEPLRPVSVTIGETTVQVTRQNEIPVFTANWILNQNIALPRLKFFQKRRKRCAVSARFRELADGTLMEIGDGWKGLRRKTERILERTRCGAEVLVKFSDNSCEVIRAVKRTRRRRGRRK